MAFCSQTRWPSKCGKVQGTIRSVARGFFQMPGIGFHDTYSPTPKLSTLRTVLACGVKLNVHFNQMNKKTAHLNAPLQGDIFMEQPEGQTYGAQA